MPFGLNWCCGCNVSEKDFNGGVKEEGKQFSSRNSELRVHFRQTDLDLRIDYSYFVQYIQKWRERVFLV